MTWAYEAADLTMLKIPWCIWMLSEPLAHSSRRITEPYSCGAEPSIYIRELANSVRPQSRGVSGTTDHDLGLSDLP